MPVDEIDGLYANVRVVVRHSGIGTILTAFENNKPLILVVKMKGWRAY